MRTLWQIGLLCAAWFLSSEGALAQGGTASIAGSWELLGTEFRGKFSSADAHERLVFSSSGSYRIYAGGQLGMPAETGVWRWGNEGRLVLSSDQPDLASINLLRPNDGLLVRTLTDSILVLAASGATPTLWKHYRRVAALPAVTMPEAQGSLGLERLDRPGRVKRIRPDAICVLSNPRGVRQGDTLVMRCTGLPVLLSDGRWMLRASELYFEYAPPGGATLMVTRCARPGEEWDIPVQPGMVLRCDSPVRQALRNSGWTIMTTGLLVALVAAPLAGIGYGGGSFRVPRYEATAGAGLAAVAVGLPFVIAAQPRSFVLDTGSSGKKRSRRLVLRPD